MVVSKDKLADYLNTDKIWYQILTGVLIGIAMSLILTLVPHLAGFGAYVDTGKRYIYLWHFVYEFFYCIAAVGFVEELVFRGFVYNRLKKISQNEITAVIGSSVLFGAFHLFGGNIVQMIMTAFIGAFFCFCRLKIKNCSLLSLIIAHGIYDALITVWASILL
ncbi:MAG: CPBP family intramembrane metalloprotease [Oscillospiraceae bacterium]|nr:CPBP family intramembrane metalloprotease [Oscillospiraceae bacterium]